MKSSHCIYHLHITQTLWCGIYYSVFVVVALTLLRVIVTVLWLQMLWRLMATEHQQLRYWLAHSRLHFSSFFSVNNLDRLFVCDCRSLVRINMAAEITRDLRWPPRSREIQDGRRGHARSKMAAEVTRDPRWPPRSRVIQDGRRGITWFCVWIWPPWVYETLSKQNGRRGHVVLVAIQYGRRCHVRCKRCWKWPPESRDICHESIWRLT